MTWPVAVQVWPQGEDWDWTCDRIGHQIDVTILVTDLVTWSAAEPASGSFTLTLDAESAFACVD